MPDNSTIRNEIKCYSTKTEEILLLLLKEQDEIKAQLNNEIREREEQDNLLRKQYGYDIGLLKTALENEKEERDREREHLQNQIDDLTKELSETKENLQNQIDKEIDERIQACEQMNDYFTKENDDRKKNLEDVNDWIRTENEKRMAEAEALRARLEREKKELQDFLEKDNKAMREKMSAEEEERKKKEKEMADKLKAQQEASENEVIQLYKKMAAENIDRINEIEELRARLDEENLALKEKMEKEKKDLKDRLEKENAELKAQLEKAQEGLKGEIDENHFSNTNRMNDLAEKLSKLLKDASKDRDDLLSKLMQESNSLKKMMGLPLSIYFCAYRTEDYETGGEEYLTFTDCYANLGGGLDSKSGIFTTPLAGAYLFVIHVCSADMSKALLAIRCNGNEVASFYDQNHESNHKNSMVGQSVLLDLKQGDKIQVYMYTYTGLQDKRSNHLTQFVGILLRPKNFCEPTVNGH